MRSRSGALTLLVLLFGACAGEGRPGRDDGAGTLTVLYPGDERILGPTWDMPAKFLTFEPLVTLDEAGEPVGRLATGWEHTPDYRRWTIRLRSDVRWHDGVPFTAHDVKFTHDLFQHPDVLWEPPDAYSVEVLDDTTLTVTAGGGCGIDPLRPWTVYYPRHLLEDLDPAGFAAWDFWTRPVGNGPYRYVRHVPRTMMELEANPEHFAGRPRVDRLILKFGEASAVELTSGNVDVAGWVTPADARRLVRDAAFDAYWTFEGPRGILWNAGHPLFRDARVRRALTHAIHRRELYGALDFPDGLPVLDGPASRRQLRRGELPEPLAYDPELAGRLLSEAGWRDTDGDGVRDRDGRPFRFELLVVEEIQAAGVFVQDQLRRVGVQVDVVLRPSVRRLWRSGDEFEAMIEFVADGWLRQFFGEESVLGYRNARVADLLAELECTFDPNRRDELYATLTDIFRSEQPATFLLTMAYWFVTDRRVRGLSSPWRADPLVNMEHVWIEEEGG